MRPTVTASISGDSVKLTGYKPAIPFAQHANFVLVPITFAGNSSNDVGVAIVDLSSSGITKTEVKTTNHEPQAHIAFDCTIALNDILGHGTDIDNREALRSIFEHSLTALAAIQVGVAEGSLAYVSTHLSSRRQFGKPLAAFQATTQRAADGYITTEAMRATASMPPGDSPRVSMHAATSQLPLIGPARRCTTSCHRFTTLARRYWRRCRLPRAPLLLVGNSIGKCSWISEFTPCPTRQFDCPYVKRM